MKNTTLTMNFRTSAGIIITGVALRVG
jgi:hypothetical protein